MHKTPIVAASLSHCVTLFLFCCYQTKSYEANELDTPFMHGLSLLPYYVIHQNVTILLKTTTKCHTVASYIITNH